MIVERQPLPKDFDAVAAILCVETWPSGGGPAFYSQRLVGGDIQELVDVLRQGDVTARSEACDDFYDAQPNLWLIGRDGSVVAPRWPLDGCGHLREPKPEEVILDALLGDPVDVTDPASP